ncbi:MarR family transcriptional regulator [Microlunatus flavus]|uniref:DNA-binding transcriptional regulator, MarR family n=1 Tax=Microlunatus flavus TaxID=1036181 RepID=A0A1H9JGC3_9ACTN|nr:helix-turn-helix domain-containing protein [Microlunatus flavus]SEQ85964.1 DNA-binding transcriptional regulator, MarR family [Microlunatus flavus]
MMGPRATAAHLEAQALAMREHNAYVVLLQDAIARSAGLNGVDLQVVGVLMASGARTPGDLAAEVGVSAGGAITALVDRLERAGYVTRRRDDADRRRVLVEAVPERVLAEVGPVYGRLAARWGAYLETLSDDQVELLTTALATATAINRDEVARLRASR